MDRANEAEKLSTGSQQAKGAEGGEERRGWKKQEESSDDGEEAARNKTEKVEEERGDLNCGGGEDENEKTGLGR